jgi:hypothetical protein
MKLIVWGFQREASAIGWKSYPTVDLSWAFSSNRESGVLWSSDMRIPERQSPEVPVGISTRSWPEVTCKNVQWRRSWHLKPWKHEGRCNFHESCAKAEDPHDSRK